MPVASSVVLQRIRFRPDLSLIPIARLATESGHEYLTQSWVAYGPTCSPEAIRGVEARGKKQIIKA